MNNKTTKAHFLHRLLAGLIGFSLMVLFYQYFVLMVLSSDTVIKFLNSALSLFVFGFIAVPLLLSFINFFLISRLGGSLGKLLAGLEIVDSQGKRISFWRAFFRNQIGYAVSASLFSLGFIWIAIDKERRGWHDLIADTYVIVSHSWGVFLGLLSLIVFLFANIFAAQQLVRTFNQNRPFYESVVSGLVGDIKTNPLDLQKPG